MNQPLPPRVSPLVKITLSLLLSGITLFLQSCSTSRTVGQEFIAPAGHTSSKTVKDSDIFIGRDSAVTVSYSEKSRYFVAQGGTLSGFQKGVNQTKIYAEKGATLPDARHLNGLQVITVDNAEQTYHNRHGELPGGETHARNRNTGYGYGYGFGYGYGSRYGYGLGYGSRYSYGSSYRFRGRSSRGFSSRSRGGFRSGSRRSSRH